MYCLQCKIPRGQDVRCRACGFVYLAPPDFYARRENPVTDPYSDGSSGMPTYVPGGIFSLILLLVITGTNATGAAVLALAGMVTIVQSGLVPLPAAGNVATFGVVAFGFDLIARRMLRCGMGDTTRGSQVMKIPAWMIGAVFTAIGLGFLVPL